MSVDQLTLMSDSVDESISSSVHSQEPSNVSDQLEKISELIKQLHESKLAEKHACDERDRYVQLYNQITHRFLSFENQQLEQMHRLLTYLTSDQHSLQNEQRARRAFTNPPNLLLLQTSLTDSTNTTADYNNLLSKISEIMDLSEKFAKKYTEQIEENAKLRTINNKKQDENMQLSLDLSLAKADYEKEQHMRHQFEKQLNEITQHTELDRSRRLQKLQNYSSLTDDESEILLSSLIKKAEKNEVDFNEMKIKYEKTFGEQVNQIRTLVKERELLHLHIERLEKENALLSSPMDANETVQLLTHASKSPQSYEDAVYLISKLREQIIEQIKIQYKLRNDISQCQYNQQMNIRERENIEELLNRELNAARDEIIVLQTVRAEYENSFNLKQELEKKLDEQTYELVRINTLVTSLTGQLNEITSEKERIDEENVRLRLQVQKLKVDFENSESVQRDFVRLSQILQMQLEEIRNSENELRWQPEDDFTECQKCHQPFSVTWRKHHCRHCGKVLCKECTNKTIYTGPNNRPSRVCDVCFMLLDKSSQPYFLSGTSKF